MLQIILYFLRHCDRQEKYFNITVHYHNFDHYLTIFIIFSLLLFYEYFFPPLSKEKYKLPSLRSRLHQFFLSFFFLSLLFFFSFFFLFVTSDWYCYFLWKSFLSCTTVGRQMTTNAIDRDPTAHVVRKGK